MMLAEMMSGDQIELIKHEHQNVQPVIPEGCNLYWSSLNVTGPERKSSGLIDRLRNKTTQRKVKEIIHNVSGMAESGKLLAIMGSSGAGKTTLLNVLTSRNLTNLDVQGSILIDGKRANKWKLREISAFVQQHDMFVGTMTAREHLKFMACLRMSDQYYSKQEREYRVEQVITQMGLQKCADTVIGIPNQLKGLSCGEKKRLAFASEILTCPKILFCDEPTSGLDAFMAGHVVQALRSLADNGMTVIITIHQPSSQVYSLFHNVCLMACGRVIYLGPGDRAVPLFEKCGFPCPPYYNPADHLIRTLAVIDTDRVNSMKTISKIRKGFLSTNVGQSILAIGNAGKLRAASYATSSETSEKSKTFFNQDYNASFWTQFGALFWRSWLTVIRDPNLLSVRLFQIVITAAITGMVFFQTPVTPETIISINGIMFNHIRNMNFMLQFPNVPVITAELPIVLRENANGVYRTSAYFLAKNIAELPQYIILPILYNTIVYWLSGLYPNFWNYCFASLVTILITNVAISICKIVKHRWFACDASCMRGHFSRRSQEHHTNPSRKLHRCAAYAVATIFANTDVAMTVLPIFVVPIMAFGGFFITFDAIPSYFTWLSSLSYFKYGYEALAINEWESIAVIPECFNSSVTAFALNGCPKNGSEVLESIDFSASHKIFDISILFIMFIGIRVIAYVALLIRSYTNN